MFLSTGILGILALILYRSLLDFGDIKKGVLYGIITSFFLYLIFLVGDFTTKIMGLSTFVDVVYNMVREAPHTTILSLSLIWIGLMEELYWRGGLQGLLIKKGFKNPWFLSSILYMLVHVVTLNPILISAALIVGLVLAKLVEFHGLYASITAHIIWLQLVMVLYPLR